jgi:2-isopropylmalate synthase
MISPDGKSLIYDWSANGPRCARWPPHVMINDETLRDGLQSPSVTDPTLEEKLQILHFMESLGIDAANLGLPGAGARQREAALHLSREIAKHQMRIRANCAARTLMADIRPIIEISQISGVAIEACLFIGSSPIRQHTEDWSLRDILRHSHDAITFALKEGLNVTFVTEDTVRSSPGDLRQLMIAAVQSGVQRFCLCDTCGSATPDAVYNLVCWTKCLLEEIGSPGIGIDWHGHRDRGLDLANALAAIEGGASRVHATALGIGERVGNTPIEQLLVNLKLLGVRNDDLTRLPEYVQLVARTTEMPIAVNAPIVGRDAFRTATGTHAAAVIKAEKKGQTWLSNRIYSGVPADWVGREQEIAIGPLSGNSNVRHYLSSHEVAVSPRLTRRVIEEAKKSLRVLTTAEIIEIVRSFPAD